MSVRKMLAVFLLACFGILLPTAASPLRICLLEDRLLTAVIASDSNCCSDCDRETEKQDPCCLDLEALPTTPAPQQSVELPPLIITKLREGVPQAPIIMQPGRGVKSRSTPIRGPTSPAAYRAVLGIWRL